MSRELGEGMGNRDDDWKERGEAKRFFFWWEGVKIIYIFFIVIRNRGLFFQ